MKREHFYKFPTELTTVQCWFLRCAQNKLFPQIIMIFKKSSRKQKIYWYHFPFPDPKGKVRHIQH